MDIGRICIKTKGREAGKMAVILDVEKEFVLIDGPAIKRRKCNPGHLFQTKEKIKINRKASHSEVVKLMK